MPSFLIRGLARYTAASIMEHNARNSYNNTTPALTEKYKQLSEAYLSAWNTDMRWLIPFVQATGYRIVIERLSGAPGADNDNVRWFFQNDSYAPHGVSGQVIFADDQIYVRTKSKYLARDHGYGLLDQNGNVVIGGLAAPFVNGLAPVIQTDNIGKYTGVGYVNMQGEWVIKFEENEF